MNTPRTRTLVLLGFLSHFPVAGVAWQTVHYLLGFQRLGFEVYYVESHGCEPSKLMSDANDDGPRRAAEYIQNVLAQFDLQDHWAYHAKYPRDRYFGLSDTRLRELYRSADWIINLHGSHLPTPELADSGRLVYLETDPVEVEIDLFHRCQKTHNYLAPHSAFFTFGENLGRSDCRVPAPEAFNFLPTRQPVILDLWRNDAIDEIAHFTTIGNWRQPWREISFQGEVYRWSKHFEFEKFIELPQRTAQTFELALSSSSTQPADLHQLESHGWKVRDALCFSNDLNAYHGYIVSSRGEFTVAKDQNIRLRSGWFSDRAATYLASGRPVISQDTGFAKTLPTGEGLFSFTTLEEVLVAVDTINADYPRHRKAAFTMAHDYFSPEVVLGDLLRRLGDRPSQQRRPQSPPPEPLPPGLVLRPVSRWPTRLPEATWKAANQLPVPVVRGIQRPTTPRASILIVTHNGLPYTKLCLTTLFAEGWNPQDELIVVDNASTDGTQEFLRQLSQEVPCASVQLNTENRGFAAANNQAIGMAKGHRLVLLNNDTLVLPGWQEHLLAWLDDPQLGLVGPVTNRTCNEAQIDAPYATYAELTAFAAAYTSKHHRETTHLPMLAMFCVAFRRDVFAKIGPLDEQFEIGMFEDDDYARRVRQAGLQIACAEDVFVHHFGQASLGELCDQGRYDEILQSNRQRFETKWGEPWTPHGRRLTPQYEALRRRIRLQVDQQLPANSTAIVISKGDEVLLDLNGRTGWHFPRDEAGNYTNIYPATSAEAIAHLEALRSNGATNLVIPAPSLWWLDFYQDFRTHLETRYSLLMSDDDTCKIFDLGGRRA